MPILIFICISIVSLLIDFKKLTASRRYEMVIYISALIIACALYIVSQTDTVSMLGTFQTGGNRH